MYPDTKDEVVQLYLDDIIPNRFQPREIFDEKALKELAVSIKEHGVIQPIIVRNVNGKYEIIAGERRYKASALAGLTKIPAIIRDLDDKESSKVALLENLQRKNLNPIEEARTYQKILEIDELTQEDLAKTMGKSQSAIANKIRLLSLPEEIQNAILKEEISERHARNLLNIPDASKQKEMLQKIIDTKMSVRSLEEEIKKQYPKKDSLVTISALPEIEPSTSAFVNTEPLVPTAELPKDTSNYGKVTIAPPIGEETSMNNKFINYGEIKKEEEEEENNSMDIPSTIDEIDMDNVRKTTIDIEKKHEKTADLDSLLNLGNPISSKSSKEIVTPTEKIVKTDLENNDMKENSDYFQLPEIPSASQFGIDNSVFSGLQEEETEKQTYNAEEAKNMINKMVAKLKEHDVKIDVNEMNFEKSYQIMIKIDKDKE